MHRIFTRNLISKGWHAEIVFHIDIPCLNMAYLVSPSPYPRLLINQEPLLASLRYRWLNQVDSFLVTTFKVAGRTNGITEWTIIIRRLFAEYANLRIDMTIFFQCLTNTTNTSIHHITRSHNISSTCFSV